MLKLEFSASKIFSGHVIRVDVNHKSNVYAQNPMNLLNFVKLIRKFMNGL